MNKIAVLSAPPNLLNSDTLSMPHSIIEGLLGGILSPYLARALQKFRYLWCFIIGFLALPLGLICYLIYKAGLSRTIEVFSSMPRENILQDMRYFLPFCFLFGAGAVIIAMLGRRTSSNKNIVSPQEIAQEVTHSSASSKNMD